MLVVPFVRDPSLFFPSKTTHRGALDLRTHLAMQCLSFGIFRTPMGLE